jgi:hypothetical protein
MVVGMAYLLYRCHDTTSFVIQGFSVCVVIANICGDGLDVMRGLVSMMSKPPCAWKISAKYVLHGKTGQRCCQALKTWLAEGGSRLRRCVVVRGAGTEEPP